MAIQSNELVSDSERDLEVRDLKLTDIGLQIDFVGEKELLVIPLDEKERTAWEKEWGEVTPGTIIRVSATSLGLGLERISRG